MVRAAKGVASTRNPDCTHSRECSPNLPRVARVSRVNSDTCPAPGLQPVGDVPPGHHPEAARRHGADGQPVVADLLVGEILRSITCLVSRVTCTVSRFTCQVYSATCHLLEVVDVVVCPGEAGYLPDRGRQHQQQQRGLSEGRPEVRPNLPRVTCVMCHVSRVQKLQPTSASLEDSVLVSALSDDDSLLLRVSLLNIFVKYFFWCI